MEGSLQSCGNGGRVSSYYGENLRQFNPAISGTRDSMDRRKRSDRLGYLLEGSFLLLVVVCQATMGTFSGKSPDISGTRVVWARLHEKNGKYAVIYWKDITPVVVVAV